LRYASESFGTLDNSDHEHGVYGAQDGYTFVNLKANWKPSSHLQFGLGIDNLLDESAWVTHPWPGRTLFLEASLRL
jgi:iron complex outermembrane receptor protein